MAVTKIVVFCALIVGLFGVAQHEHWFERIGVVGGCELTSPPASQQGQWWSCREGVLTGYPSLVRESCSLRGKVVSRQVWHCPQPIARPSAL